MDTAREYLNRKIRIGEPLEESEDGGRCSKNRKMVEDARRIGRQWKIVEELEDGGSGSLLLSSPGSSLNPGVALGGKIRLKSRLLRLPRLPPPNTNGALPQPDKTGL